MSEVPQVACIIANYNNSNYLEECVSSVLAQTVRVDEIIIADDASTDDSRQMIIAMAAQYDNIIPILRTHNIGVSQNRHKAILASKAQLITTLDSDDFFYPTKIESELNALMNTGSDIAFSDVILVDNHSNEIQKLSLKYFGKISSQDQIKALIHRKYPIPRDMLIKRGVYDSVGGFSEKLKVYEDDDLKMRFLINTSAKWVYSHAPGTAYRQLPDGLSKNRPFNNMMTLYRLLIIDNSPAFIKKIGFGDFTISLIHLTIFHIRKAFSYFTR
jgi:glycosyltransferase involved in cell wall biosynthesis